jgi:cytochrome P450
VAAEEHADRLTEEELLANAVLLLMNGHETTTYMIGCVTPISAGACRRSNR